MPHPPTKTLDHDGPAGQSDVVGLMLLARIKDGQVLSVGEDELQGAVLVSLEAFYRGTEESYCPSGNLRRTWLRFPNPFDSPIEIVELHVGGNPYVFIKAELDLVNADGDLFDLSAV